MHLLVESEQPHEPAEELDLDEIYQDHGSPVGLAAIEQQLKQADQSAFDSAMRYLCGLEHNRGQPSINIRQHGRGPHSVTAGNRHCWEPDCEVCAAEKQAAADRDAAMSMGLDSPGEVGVHTTGAK